MASFLFYFARYGNCHCYLISLVLFYAFRGMVQNLFVFSFYDNYLFDFKGGFYSFFVPYGRESDFFYSGHCGIATLATLTFRDLNIKPLYYFGIIVTFLQIMVMTSITRAHYSIDALFGVLFAFYFFKVGKSIYRTLKERNWL